MGVVVVLCALQYMPPPHNVRVCYHCGAALFYKKVELGASYLREFARFRRRAREPRKLEVGELKYEVVAVDEDVGRLE